MTTRQSRQVTDGPPVAWFSDQIARGGSSSRANYGPVT